MTYNFSITHSFQQPVLRRRPWWKLWGCDAISYEKRYQTRLLQGLNEKQRAWLEQGVNNDPDIAELVRSMILRPGEELVMVTLEAAP